MTRHVDRHILVLAAVLVAWNAFLFRRSEPPRPPVLSPRIGALVPPIPGQRLDGRMTTIRVDRPLIIHVFDVACARCDDDIERARRLSEQIGGRYRFVGLALTEVGLGEYVARHSLRWEIVTRVPQTILDAYGIGAAPLTIAIDDGGRISHVWWRSGELPPRQ